MNLRFLINIIGGILLYTSIFAQSGLNLFNDQIVHTIEIIRPNNSHLIDTLSAWHLQALIFNTPEEYDTVTIIFDGTIIVNCGIRCKGRESFLQEYKKKPLKIKPNKFVNNQTIDGIKEFNLHSAMGDPSQMRDKICYDIFRNSDVKTARVSFAKVFINGNYHGLFSIVENIDKQFLETNFGNNDGNLYESNNTVINPPFAWKINGQPKILEDTLTLIKDMELKNNTSKPDHSKFIKFLDVLNNSSSANFPDSISKYFNIHSFLKIAAIDFILLNTDSYLNGGGNFYLFYNIETSKFEWIPYDYNWAINYLLDQTSDDPAYKGLISNPLFNKTVLLNRILNVNQFKLEFYNNIYEQLLHRFNSFVIDEKVNNLKALIASDVYKDTNKSFSDSEFDDNTTFTSVPFYIFQSPVPAIKQFTYDRNQYLTDQLVKVGFSFVDVKIEEPKLSPKMTLLFPNPASTLVQINSNFSVAQINVYSILGQKLITVFNQNKLLISNLAQSIVIVNVILSNNDQFNNLLLIQR